MKMPSIFKPKSVATGLLLAGVLLTPMLSHGCQVKGSSPESSQAVYGPITHQSG